MFLHLLINILIFYRLFALAVYNKQTIAGKQEALLLKNIQDSIKKKFGKW